MNDIDYTADHLEYLVKCGWTLNTGVISYHLLTRPGEYIIIEPTGFLHLFRWSEVKRSYEFTADYFDTRPLGRRKFAMLCDVMDLAKVAENLANVFVKS